MLQTKIFKQIKQKQMAAKASNEKIGQGGKKRKGVHAKSKNSKLKNSKNYRKTYKGQGR